MSRSFTFLSFIVLLFSISACERDKSCALMDYTYVLPQQAYQEASYIKLYGSEDNFVGGKDAVGITDSSANDLRLTLPSQTQAIPFLDIRYPDGTNSWSNQAALAQLSKTTVSSANCEVTAGFDDYTSLKNIVKSSPIFMHLVLENGLQDGGTKSWLIDKIYDEDEFDVSDRPEWACLKTLGFTFFKGGKGAKVKITIGSGENACGVLGELFGDKSEAFATYSLEGNDQKELRITVPAVSEELKKQLTFKVIESDYNHLKISLTNNNAQIGYAVLIPLNHE